MNLDNLEQDLVEFTRELIRSPSINPPGDTVHCAKIILDRFKQSNIDAQLIEGKRGASNVVAKLFGKKKGKTLLLNGHLDVVPPAEGWTVDPFGGEILNNEIYGRGASDMKSGVASMISAMIEFKRSRATFDGEIIFTGVADEETGSEYGTLHLLRKDIIKNADFAVVAEPTNLKVGLGNRGLRWIDIFVRGKSSHAGRPHLGINAISYAAKLIDGIHSTEFKQRNDLFEIPFPNISVTMISGGTKVNIVPDTCTLSVDRRMIPGETTETVIRELKEVIDPILKKERELQIELKFRPNYWDPYLISETEPIVRATVESFTEVTGKRPKLHGKAACTDASYLFHSKGIPTVLFGPGNELLSHKADESVSIKNLVLATKTFVSIFNRLLGS